MEHALTVVKPILDVLAPHRDEAFKDTLKAVNIKSIYGPTDCTSDGDGSVYSVVKQKMADAHSSYCRGEILKHIANNGYDVSDEYRPNTAIQT